MTAFSYDPDARYDVLAVTAHPDDVEAALGGTMMKLAEGGLRILAVDLCDGEPARHAVPGARHEQAARAAYILGVDRLCLGLRDRLIRASPEASFAVAGLVRQHRPRTLFTTARGAVHPDHREVADLVTDGAFYARLPKWDRVPGGEALEETEPHNVERIFFGHCRMEPWWDRFDFAVDVTPYYERKLEALAAYDAVFAEDAAVLIERYGAEDRHVGALVGVPYAEAFRARSPLLIHDPTLFAPTRYG